MAKKVAKKTPGSGKTAKSSRRKPAASEATDTCFVMMPFSDPFNAYYNTIYRPAIEAAGLRPVRADDLFRPSVIVSDLWTMIQTAGVLLAELTTKNANVFYELGLGHAIGKPIVMVSETMSDVPFDLQQLRVLLYDKDDPAWGERLTDAITRSLQETLESPVEAVPSIFRKKVESQAPEQDATIARIEMVEKELRLLRNAPSQHAFTARKLGHANDQLTEVYTTSDLDKWVEQWSPRFPMTELAGLVEAEDHLSISRAEFLARYAR